MTPLKSQFVQKPGAILFSKIKQKILFYITKNSSNVFVRAGDVISLQPLESNTYEPRLAHFIDDFAQNGYGDFFIDIGANIGLTSRQHLGKFKVGHLFEPNPMCVKLLEVNLGLAVPNNNYTIHPVGLGVEDVTINLTVPKNNWGGAFIDDTNNHYDKKTLSQKENLSNFDDSNFFIISITVKRAVNALREVFASLQADGHNAGVIKIDVEGYERVILEAIAQTLPINFDAIIFFESWNSSLDLSSLSSAFDDRVKIYKLKTTPDVETSRSWFYKFFRLVASSSVVTVLDEDVSANLQGDMALVVRSSYAS